MKSTQTLNFFLFLFLAGTAFGQVQYSITDLGTLLIGGGYSIASGINNNGQVVGTSNEDPFLYSNGSMKDLGALNGAGYNAAFGINNSGQVVGQAYFEDDDWHAFLYSGGSMQDIGTLGGSETSANGINDSGQIVGESGILSQAFLYSNGTMVSIGGDHSSGDCSWANAINASGQIVGRNGNRAFLYSGGFMQGLGTLGGSLSEATGINANGQIVGFSYTSADAALHAFLYINGTMNDLGTLGGSRSEALGINANGWVVGYSYDANNNNHAFLYCRGTMTDLNSVITPSSGWTLIEATAINDKGQIVGYGTNPAGNTHAFLLSPMAATLIVAPSTTTAYGSLLVGTTADRTFNVFNVGTSTVPVTMSVASPFSVVSGGSYTLAPGQSTNTTIRYAPTSAGNSSSYVTFTGGGDQTRQVTGSAYTDPTPTTGAIVGQVTRSDTGTALGGIGITVIGPGGDIIGSSIPGTVSTYIGGEFGQYSITGLPPNAHYQVVATPQGYPFNITNLSDVSVVAGQTTTVNITMTPVSPPPPSLPTPVVLVRGLGADQDWEDEVSYFGPMSMALYDQGFSEVWTCNEPEAGILDGTGHVIDGTKHIAYNAYMLWSYLQAKALQYKQQYGDYPAQVNIIAHSMGGLITRQALLNMDHFYFRDLAAGKRFSVKVGKVIMLGTPNAGTPLADIDFWPISDAVHDLTTTFISGNNGANNGFNASYSWPSGVSLYLYGGTGGRYSGNPILKAGAAALALGNEGDRAPWGVSDGAVPLPSVSGTEYLFGSSAYVNYFKASPTEDVTDLDITGSLDHFSLLTDTNTLNWIIAKLTGTVTSVKALSGKPRPAIPTPMGASPTKLLPMQSIEQTSSLLASGQLNTASVISDAATTLSFQLLAQATDVVFRVQSPLGTIIDSNTPASNTNVQYSAMIGGSNLMLITCTISNPATGTWQAILDGSSMSETQASCLLRVFGDSTVSLLPQTINPCNPGQDLVVSCALADLSTNPAMPVVNASITATIQLPDGSTNDLTLFDDGWHNDGAPNDGVYAAVLTNMQQAGTYSIAYRATGTNSQGQALQRVANGGFSVSSGRGCLLGDPVYENLDTDGDGIADFLEVKCWVNPTTNGNYILAGDLVDVSGTNRFSQSAAFAADGTGPTMVTLIFNLAEIRAAGGSGNFHIENLQLFEVTSAGTAWLDAYRGSSVVNIQATAILTVSTNGIGSLSTNYNGSLLQVGSSYAITATAGSGFMFTNWTGGTNLPLTILTNGPTVQFVMEPNLMLQANFVDLSKPTVSITNVPVGLSVSNAAFTVKGAASDNWQMTNVFYSLNNAGWNNALTTNAWTNWSATVTLIPGTNTIAAYAVDPAGDVSPITNASLFFVVTNQISIRSVGLGTIKPNYSNAWLNIGQNYSITSAPATGFIFTNWLVSTNWIGGATVTGTNLQFMMQSNLTLQANFVDVQNPTNSITSPVPGQLWSNTTFTVTGTASDNAAVSNVLYSLNDSVWTIATLANNWSNWTATVNLIAGTNTIQAYAVDTSGNFSATNSVSFDVILSTVLTVSTNGLGSLNPNYNNALLQVGKSYSITATSGTGFRFTNWTGGISSPLAVLTNGVTLQFVMQSNLVLQANFWDTNRPALSITNLTAGQRWSNLVFTVMGTATDNWQVASVQVQLNGGIWTNATGTTNWSAPLTLTPGTNTFTVFATDTTGNNSMTNSVSFQYVVTNLLAVRATGLGTISPNYSNSWLEIGRNYSMTATPATGFVVTNWTISTNWLGGRITNNATVQFMMASNLTLQVNFADVTMPTLTITSPTARQHMTNALATFVGTASDNWKVAGVWYQLNSNAWNLVTATTNNYTNWTQAVTLLTGLNTFKAYAVDLGGNFSATNPLNVISSNTFMLQLAFTNSLPLKTNGLVFILQLSTGLNGHIQVSTNLTSWTTLTNFVGTNATLTFRDPAATNSSRRFYRAVIP